MRGWEELNLKTQQQKTNNRPDPVTGNPPISQKARSFATWIIVFGAVVETLQTALPQLLTEFPDAKWIGKVIFLLGLIWLAIQRSNDAIKQE